MEQAVVRPEQYMIWLGQTPRSTPIRGIIVPRARRTRREKLTEATFFSNSPRVRQPKFPTDPNKFTKKNYHRRPDREI